MFLEKDSEHFSSWVHGKRPQRPHRVWGEGGPVFVCGLGPVQELLVFPVISLASHLSEPECLHSHDTQQGLGL